MKKLLVWLASVSICAAQAVSIGPFATENWVEDRIHSMTNDFATVPYVDDLVSDVEDQIPDVSGLATKEYVDAVSNAIPDTSTFSTVEYVNTTSNNLALLIDDLVSEEELANIKIAWDSVTNKPPFISEDDVTTFVSNIVPGWALVPIPPVTVEIDPAFTNWLATTNSATVQYVDDHRWDWSTKITNAPAFIEYEVDPTFTNWLATTNFVWYADYPGYHKFVDSNGNELIDRDTLPKYAITNGQFGNVSVYIPVVSAADGTGSFGLRADSTGAWLYNDGYLYSLNDHVTSYTSNNKTYLSIPGTPTTPAIDDFVFWDGSTGRRALYIPGGGSFYLDSTVQGSFDGYDSVPTISFSVGNTHTNIALNLERYVSGYAPGEGYSEPMLYFNKSGRTYTVPTNWIEGSYISSANGSYFNYSVPELRFKDGSGYTAYPLIGNYDKDWSYNRGNGISLVTAVTGYDPNTGQTEVTNGYHFSIYPEAYTYFYNDHGDLMLMNSMYAPGTYSYQSVNFTHPEVDYLRITNSLGYAFVVRIPNRWGYDEYPYYLPTNYVDGTWVLARTNDIPAAVDSAMASDYVAKYWPYDSMAHNATTLRLGSKEYPMNRLVSGYNTRYNYPSSHNEVTLTFSDYYAIDGEDSSQYPSYTWTFKPADIAKIEYAYGGYGTQGYYLYKGSDEIYDLFNPRPSSVVFTNANSVYDFVKYTHGYSSAYFKLPTDNLPYSDSGTYTIAIEDNRVPVFVGTDSASDPTILSNRSTGVTYDMRRVAMFNDSVDYGILTNPYGRRSWDLDDMVGVWTDDMGSGHHYLTNSANGLRLDLDKVITEETDPVWTKFKNDTLISTTIDEISGDILTNMAIRGGGLVLMDGTGYGREHAGHGSLSVGEAAAIGTGSIASGYSVASNFFSVALTGSMATNNLCFVWGDGRYGSHGEKTFNVNPAGGAAGVWIGETNLATFVTLEPVFAGYTDWTFSPSNTYDGCGLKMVHTSLDGRPVWALFGRSGLLGYSFGDDDSTSQTFYSTVDWTGGYTLYATRKELTAYRLGSQSNKLLATYCDVSSKASLEAIAPAWKAGNVYTNGDFVMHSAYLYECVHATSGSVWNPIEWKQTSVAEILGNLRRILDAINGEAL